MAGRLNEDIPSDENKAHVDPKPTEVEDKEHAISFVKETQERDVPERVAEDPEVQHIVLSQQRRERDQTKEPSGESGHPSSPEQGQLPQEKKAPSSSRRSWPPTVLLGVVIGSVLALLAGMLHLRYREVLSHQRQEDGR